MEDEQVPDGRIQVLPEQVSRKIAAGEVIERPQAAVRELLDNAIDSGATEISLWLHNGGNDEIIIQDNGCGMGKEDMYLCCHPHATSKIRTEDDLYRISSLGFRGEALAAIAAVSQLEIASSTGDTGHILRMDGGLDSVLTPAPTLRGTKIKVRNLFYNLPARQQFLKRGSTEFSLCQSTFIEKALCFPGIHFRLFHEGELRLNLMPCPGDQGYLERTWQCWQKDLGDKKFLNLLEGTCEGARLKVLSVSPEIYRHDRKILQIFVNKRRIVDFGLSQALEYGYTGYLPGGRFPLAFAWIEVNPELLDVNIHPAKREVKIKNHGEIHHRLVGMIQNHLRNATIKARTFNTDQTSHSGTIQERVFPDLLIPAGRPRQEFNYAMVPPDTRPPLVPGPQTANFSTEQPQEVHDTPAMENQTGPVRYLGQIFGCFLCYVEQDEMVLLDMHAAHERILFNRYLQGQAVQQHLLGRQIQTNEFADLWLEREKVELEKMGFYLSREDRGTWELSTCPSWMADHESVFERFLEKPFGEAIEAVREMAAQTACRAAVKDGDTVAPDAALKIIEQARRLEDPRCPHGRPIWYRLSREELFTLIGRHV